MDRVVLVSLLWACACVTPAAQSKKAVAVGPSASAAQDTTRAASNEAVTSPWREMTWAEYYSSVMRNVTRRGGTVIWINPPEVREVEATTAAPAASAKHPAPKPK